MAEFWIQCQSSPSVVAASAPLLASSRHSDSDRSFAFPLPSFPHCTAAAVVREREGGGMVHASTPAAAAAYAPSITNVNSQDGSLSHWLRRRRRSIVSALLAWGREGGREARKLLPWQLFHAAETQGSTKKEAASAFPPSLVPLFILLLSFIPLFPSLLYPPPPSLGRRRREARVAGARSFVRSGAAHAEKGRGKDGTREVGGGGGARQLVLHRIGLPLPPSLRPF